MKMTTALRLKLALIALTTMLGTVIASANPTILNFTESAGPGEVISIQGDKFGTSPQVLFHRVLTTDTTLTPDATPLTQVSSYLSSVGRGYAITVQLPKTMPMGLYAIWVKDPSSGTSAPQFINRARATGFEFAEMQSGTVFRIFGRNLSIPGQTPIVTMKTGSTTLGPLTNTTNYPGDPNILQVTAPALATGAVYTVQVSNAMGHNTLANDVTTCPETITGWATGTDVYGINVPWGQDAEFATMNSHTIDVTAPPYNADKTGVANCVNAIQQAIYDASNMTGGGTVYLPAGTYHIDHAGENATFVGAAGATITQPLYEELVIPNYVVIKGDPAPGATVINDSTAGMPYPDRSLMINNTSPTHIGLLNLTYQQSSTVTTAAPPAIILSGSHSFYCNLYLTFAHDAPPMATGGEFEVANSTSHDVLVDNVHLDYGGFVAQTGAGRNESNIIIRNNTFLHHGNWKRTRMLMGGTVDLIFENNQCERDSQWPGDHAHDDAYEQGQVECDYASNHTYLNNTFYADNAPLDTNDNSGETIGSQGGAFGADDTGTVTAVGTSSVTDSARTWPVGGLLHHTVTLTGVAPQETRTILSNTATNIVVSSNWTSPYPISTYKYQVNNSSGTTIYSGTLTAGSTNSISDRAATFASGLSGTVVLTPPGTQTQTITANTATSVTVANQWNPTPTTAFTYDVTHLGYDVGTVTGVSGTGGVTVSCATKNPSGVNDWQTSEANNTFAIVSGTGMGQRRTIVSNTATSVTVDSAWDVPPDNTSVYAITNNTADHFLIKGNTFTDQPRSISLYLGCHDCAVVGNFFKNTGQAIWFRATQIGTDPTVVWEGLMNLAWDNTATDNLSVDTTGLYPAPFATNGNSTGNVPIGTQVLNTDFRRNIVFTDCVNPLPDAGSSLYEGYTAFNYTHSYYSTLPVVLGSLFDDNESYCPKSGNTLYPIYLNSDSYLTTINHHFTTGFYSLPYSETYPAASITGSAGPSVQTTVLNDQNFLLANFSGTGASTGGTSDGVDAGGAGTLTVGKVTGGAPSFNIVGTTPFTTTSGDYLECVIGPGTIVGHYMIQPTNERTSWGRIFDLRTYDADKTTGRWLVNGAFDFFWRPAANVTTSNAMRPIDINNGTNGLRLIFDNSGGGLTWQIVTATGGGGVNLTSSAQTFTMNTTYHIAMTFKTDAASGLTTETMYMVSGNNPITPGTTTPIGSTTFTLNPQYAFNSSGFLDYDPWNFGDVYGNTATNVNDYEGFKLYSQIPTTFPGL